MSFHISRMLFASKSSRLFLLIYVVGLHLLVIGVMFWLSHADEGQSTHNAEFWRKVIEKEEKIDVVRDIGLAVKRSLGAEFAKIFCI